jgi:FlaA1/EpsC-like NDP-sugar epimerase/lipopolysaccharide/colanic/teichoic acid biosynthesis glycosyltransferase
MLKRLIDILLSFLGIALTLPFFPFITLLIKVNSKGPVFYLCDRVGKDWKLFKMYKFRTMLNTPKQIGPSLCPEGDPRVTSLGRFLRRTKLNELPQLINIFKGDMTFVGPRPEAPDLAALYPRHASPIFAVKPGLVGPNQILGRNEEEWYPPGIDPHQHYINVILPKKLPLDLEYVQQSSVFTDLKYIFLGVKETLFKALNWKFVLQNQSQIYLLLADLAISLISFVLAHMLKFAGLPQGIDSAFFLTLLPAVVLVRVACFVFCGLYGTLIRYISVYDIIAILKGVTTGSLLLVSLTFLSNFRAVSRSVFLIDWLCLIFLMSALRFALRLFRDARVNPCGDGRRRVLIFGAGDAGALAYHSLRAEKESLFELVGFLDDDPAKRHKMLYGKKVLGNRFTLGAVVKLYQVHEILLAVPSAPPHEIDQVVQACQKAGVYCRVFPTLKTPPPHVSSVARELSLAELFETQDVQMDATAVGQILQDKRVLITGASGALGLELCRQILHFSPQKLVIIDRYESYLSELVARLLNTFPAERIAPVLCPPVSGATIATAFQDYQPHIVLHTAMRKFSPFFDIQVEDVVVRVNYLSTFELAKQAARCGCEYFVMVSSLEAAKRGNPVSNSLRAAEISLQQFFASKPTKLVTVRLCDILENRGGVVAILKEQIAHQEIVTLPHFGARHQFLSKHAAAHLILQALALVESNSSEKGIFVCNNGPPISLMEVASKLAMLNGLQLETDFLVKYLDHGAPDDTPTTEVPSGHSKEIVATSHAHIGLLRQDPLPDSPEVDAAIHYLLNLQEHDLEHAVWEESTRRLLLLEEAS